MTTTKISAAKTVRALALFLGAALIELSAGQAHAANVLRMATTTSTEQSGLLRHLLPAFQARSGVEVQVIAVGSGKALELGKNGDVDVVLVHARAAEDQFIAQGHGIDRRDVMYNDFVVVCPQSDPARIKGGRDVALAFRKLAASNVRFIARGDKSGTDMAEQSYWQAAGVKPSGPNYLSAGLGMGEVLNMAAEMQACTLSDRATFVTYRARTGLAVMVEGDTRMRNPYGIISVNPARHPGLNHGAARQLSHWLTSEEGRARIASFRVEGQQLFFPAPPKP